MAALVSKKKTHRLIYNNRQGGSFISDAGSLGGISTISDSRVIRHKRKSQKSIKDSLVKPKILQNTFGIRQTFNITENVRRIRSVSSDIIICPPFVINEENKNHSRVTKEKMHIKNLAKRLIAKRKPTVHKTDNSISKERKKTIAPELNNRSDDFENASDCIKKSQFNSLLDFVKNKNVDAIFPHASCRQNSFPVTPSKTLNLSNVKSRQRKSHFDYLKEFDLIRFRDSKKLVELSEDERIFTLVPKISPFEPVTLPRKKYKHCVMSIKDSKDVLHRSKENDSKELNETTMNIEFENADEYLSKSFEDTWFANDKNYVLIAKKPVRIKCIDEASNGIRDIIIYSDEFLKATFKEKGKCASKKEVYESILKESTEYKGKSLRIIIDAEKYSCCLDSNRQFEGDIKTEFSKIPTKIPSKISKPVECARKMSSRIPRCNKSSGTFYIREQTKKEAPIEENTPLTNDNSNETVDIESAVANQTELGDSHLDENKRSESMEILKKENKKLKFINEIKSRTALKRINIECIIGSNFSHYFHFYAKLGRPLKSGVAISKTNSIKWLERCGIVHDNVTKNWAEKYFISEACAKCVLNICDYVKFLNKIAKDKHMLLVDIVYRMMSVDLNSMKKPGLKQVAIEQAKETVKNSPPETKPKQIPKSKKGTKHRSLDNNPLKKI